jgi:hypothetical protein
MGPSVMGPSTKELWRAGCVQALDNSVDRRKINEMDLASFKYRVRTARQARSPEGDRALIAILREYCPQDVHVTSYPGSL